MQNSEFAYFSSKSGKHMKQMPSPPFWGDVAMKKWSRSPRSAHFQVPENGTLSARIKKRRLLFHANTLPKWWSRHLFHVFTTSG